MEETLAATLEQDVDSAFPTLVAALAHHVYNVGLRLCGRQDAEDVAQEAFARAYRALHEYTPERRRDLQLRPWVLTIALNVARNRVRSNGRTVPVDPEAFARDGLGRRDPLPTADTAAEQGDLRRRLTAALDRLPPPTREAVVLRHVVGCPVAEVAAVLGRPQGTVKAQVWRGLAALREDLAGDGHIWEGE